MSSVYPTRQPPAVAKAHVSIADEIPADANIPDNYVQYTLKKEKALPPLTLNNFMRELNWLNVVILCVTPVLGVVGVCYTKLYWKTAAFAVFYYYLTGLGE